MHGNDPAIAYLRVSVVGDRRVRGRLESPELQREAIDGWAAANGVRVVDEIRDLNRSGGTLTRPGLTKALERVRSGEAKGIVVARSDRASRRTVDGLGLIDELDDLGGWIAAADGSIDTTDRTRRMATTMMFAVGQHELERYQEQSAITHRKAILEKGRHMGPAPFGYRRNADGRLELDPERVDAARLAFERRADGAGWVTISRELDALAVRTVDGRRVNPHLLRRMISRRVYLGEASHGPHVAAGAHPALIDEALWGAANRAAPSVRSTTQGPRVHEDSLLRGLLRCAGCRYALKRQPQRESAPSWRCRTILRERSATHSCALPVRLNGHDALEAEGLVVERFMALASEVGARREDTDEDLGALERRVGEAEALLDELASLELRRELGAVRWGALVADARAGADTARHELAAAQGRARVAGGTDRATLEQTWQGMTLAERQGALRSVVQAVMIDARKRPVAERVDVVPVWEGIDLPYKGSRNFAARRWRRGGD